MNLTERRLSWKGTAAVDKTVKIKLVRPGAKVPTYATPGAAAVDLRSAADGPVVIAPGSRAAIPTGIAISLGSAELAAFVFARSGLGMKKGICLSNGVGVIDSDYTGEICVGLLNTSDEEFVVSPGDRIAQLAVMPVCRAAFSVVDELEKTERGSGGFGSTGIR